MEMYARDLQLVESIILVVYMPLLPRNLQRRKAKPDFLSYPNDKCDFNPNNIIDCHSEI